MKKKKELENLEGYKLMYLTYDFEMESNCQRLGCNHRIKYLFHIKHDTKGKKYVGSTCIEQLSLEDQYKGLQNMEELKFKAKIISKSWKITTTLKGFEYQYYYYKNTQVRLYKSNYDSYGIQVVLITNKGKDNIFSNIENFKSSDLVKVKLEALNKADKFLNLHSVPVLM